jgi:MoaA/NifB/PqqE/SkfB family radical SAM enzyme
MSVELRERILWMRGAEERFLSVYMDQNNKCNLKCRMCGFSDPRARTVPAYDMPRALFESIAAQLFPRTSYLALSLMTEPFMTRDFPDRLHLVRDYGVPFSDIITNGLILNERAIAKIVDAGITRLTFSIDGGTKELYESIRAGAKFENVVRNVRLFRSMRGATLLRINHVLSEVNIDHFDGFLDLVEELGANMIEVRTISPMGEAELHMTEDPAFWSKVREACAKLAAFCARTGIEDSGYLRDRAERIELCDAHGVRMTCRRPWDTLAIHGNGDAYVCMAWDRGPLGNFAHQTFEEMWSGPAMEALRAEFDEVEPGVDCLHCTIRTRSGSRSDGEFFHRKLAKPLEV